MSYTISAETKRRLALGLAAKPRHRNRRRKSSRLLITAISAAAAFTAWLFFIH